MKIIDNDLTIQEVCGRIGGYHRCSLEEGYPFLYVSLKFQEIFGWSKEEIELTESSTQKFLQQVIEEHFNRVEGKGEMMLAYK